MKNLDITSEELRNEKAKKIIQDLYNSTTMLYKYSSIASQECFEAIQTCYHSLNKISNPFYLLAHLFARLTKYKHIVKNDVQPKNLFSKISKKKFYENILTFFVKNEKSFIDVFEQLHHDYPKNFPLDSDHKFYISLTLGKLFAAAYELNWCKKIAFQKEIDPFFTRSTSEKINLTLQMIQKNILNMSDLIGLSYWFIFLESKKIIDLAAFMSYVTNLDEFIQNLSLPELYKNLLFDKFMDSTRNYKEPLIHTRVNISYVWLNLIKAGLSTDKTYHPNFYEFIDWVNYSFNFTNFQDLQDDCLKNLLQKIASKFASLEFKILNELMNTTIISKCQTLFDFLSEKTNEDNPVIKKESLKMLLAFAMKSQNHDEIIDRFNNSLRKKLKLIIQKSINPLKEIENIVNALIPNEKEFNLENSIDKESNISKALLTLIATKKKASDDNTKLKKLFFPFTTTIDLVLLAALASNDHDLEKLKFIFLIAHLLDKYSDLRRGLQGKSYNMSPVFWKIPDSYKNFRNSEIKFNNDKVEFIIQKKSRSYLSKLISS